MVERPFKVVKRGDEIAIEGIGRRPGGWTQKVSLRFTAEEARLLGEDLLDALAEPGPVTVGTIGYGRFKDVKSTGCCRVEVTD